MASPLHVHKMTGGKKAEQVLNGISYTRKVHILADRISRFYIVPSAKNILFNAFSFLYFCNMIGTEKPRMVHEGRNLKRIREILQVKQSALATDLGGDWNQKKVSQLEDKEIIDQSILDDVAKALKVTPDAIKNFNEEAAINVVQNNYEGSNNHGDNNLNYYCTFNPLEKYIEAMEENKKLYERLLQAEKEKNELLANLVSTK
jgi:transcriptional regulator with XRE-family HTH domain